MQEDAAKLDKKEEKTYTFLRRDPADRRVLHCTHPDATGSFLLAKRTTANVLAHGRVKGMQLGAFPLPDYEGYAERYAHIAVGYDKVPDGFKLDEITDDELFEALGEEVMAYWATFHAKK